MAGQMFSKQVQCLHESQVLLARQLAEMAGSRADAELMGTLQKEYDEIVAALMLELGNDVPCSFVDVFRWSAFVVLYTRRHNKSPVGMWTWNQVQQYLDKTR